MTNQSMPNPENITRTTLDNGITVLIRENHAAPVAVLDGYLAAGSLHDPVDKRGLSSFVAGMLTRGSAHYDFDTFNETIESVGASLSAGSGTHTTSFGIHCLSEDFPNMLQVLADVLCQPTFPQEHIELTRSRKLVGMQQRQQDTQSMASLCFSQALYGDHPYSHPVSGYPETIMAIEQADLITFHRQQYTPDQAVLVVVGDVETDNVLAQLNEQLGQWQRPAADLTISELTLPTGPQHISHTIADKVQSDIIIGFPAMPRSHPDFNPGRVANTILGQFGMMGRLGERVREAQGLAYSCASSLDVGALTGVWSAMAGVNLANVEQAIESIMAEFSRLAHEPVTATELADSQAYMTGVLPLTLETNDGVAATLINMERYGLGLDYLQCYPDLIYGVTIEDVQRVAHTYLDPERVISVVAGSQR